jgi:hypothetical protein
MVGGWFLETERDEDMISERNKPSVAYREEEDEISGSHGGEYEVYSFWDVAPCSLNGVDRRFRGAYCNESP